MTIKSSIRHYIRITQHFASTRATEVLALQASPLFGLILSGFLPEKDSWIRAGLLLLGSLALTFHIFIFNDWAGHANDVRDPKREMLVFSQHGISRRQVAVVALLLLILANIAFWFVSGFSMLLGAAIASLSFLYSCSPNFGKHAPIVGSINHFLGGIVHFLLGYTLNHALDLNGLVLSLFFGLVFAGGHLNQEVRDYEGDLLNGIRTTAVVFGRDITFWASLCVFTVAYAITTSLAVLGYLPGLLVYCPVLWFLHLLFSVHAFQRGLNFETAKWVQKRYRLLFALVGLAMLAR